jgi:subtilisin family serine protease
LATSTQPTFLSATSIADVIAAMSSLQASLADDDGLKWFNYLYLEVTKAVDGSVNSAQFLDSQWIADLDVVFANLYFAAVNAADSGSGDVPSAWQPLFAARNQPGIARIQYALAGMNAHINRDLPVALVSLAQETGNFPSRTSNQFQDYQTVNSLLKAVEARVKAELLNGIPTPALADVIAMWSVERARDAAWTNAEILWHLQAIPALAEGFLQTLDRTIGLASRGLLVHEDRVRTAKSEALPIPDEAPMVKLVVSPKVKEPAGLSGAKYSAARTGDYVICELTYDSHVGVPAGALAFASPESAVRARQALNRVLESVPIKQIAPLFGSSLKKQVFAQRLAAPNAAAQMTAPNPEFALAGFVAIVPKNAKDCDKLIDRLKQTPTVWKAYRAPRPEPAAKSGRPKKKPTKKAKPRKSASPAEAPIGNAKGSRNFEPSQGYLCDAPNGIGAYTVWGLPGGAGKGVTICDIEGAWNLKHEDLPTGIKLIGGSMIDDLDWRNHGTAVLGEMVSTRGNVGCVGISHEANVVTHSHIIGGLSNPAGAILAAANALSAGDVILIELHAPGGPDQKYVAMQFWDPIFAAIRIAVAKGVVVVEAGGNGNENFDRPEYAGTGLQKDSGAIVVGAGVPPTNYFDAYDFYGSFPPYSRIGAPRSRIWFSNYGQIVDLQGWGWHVTTLAYGDAQGGEDEKRWYTLRFSGTSSASPIVTGAVACLQGFAKARIKRPLTPLEVRDILRSTGTPQVDDAPRAPTAQSIGPQPNLAAALREVETRFKP